jgi:hypothetical protein
MPRGPRGLSSKTTHDPADRQRLRDGRPVVGEWWAARDRGLSGETGRLLWMRDRRSSDEPRHPPERRNGPLGDGGSDTARSPMSGKRSRRCERARRASNCHRTRSPERIDACTSIRTSSCSPSGTSCGFMRPSPHGLTIRVSHRHARRSRPLLLGPRTSATSTSIWTPTWLEPAGLRREARLAGPCRRSWVRVLRSSVRETPPAKERSFERGPRYDLGEVQSGCRRAAASPGAAISQRATFGVVTSRAARAWPRSRM